MRKIYTSLVLFLAMIGFAAVSHAQTITGLAPITFSEGAAPIVVQPGITVTGGSGYGGGYMLFKITNPNIGDQFSIFSEPNPTAAGAISVSNGGVFLGNGTTTTLVGSIDGILNGQNGKDLKINFTSNFSNSSFESGLDGWTVGTSFVNLGVTQIAGFTSPNDPTYPANSGGDDVAPRSASYNYELSTSQFSAGSKSLRLYSTMTTTAGCDVVHGPYVYSSPFQSNAGDVLQFDWRAFAGNDAYDVFGYILNVNTGATTIVLNATGGTSGNTNWANASVTVPATGSYRFVFVSGTYDATCGLAAGASLYIDNVRVFGDNVNADVITNIANNVMYQSTCGTSNADRNLQVSITKTNNTTVSASSTIELNTVAPVINCQNINVALNGAGQAIILPASLNNGSTDDCPITYTASKTNFNCNDLGTNNVVLTATDSYGNSSTCNAVVNVVDNLPPVPNQGSLPVVTTQCNTSVTAPTATDNCNGSVTGTTSQPTTYSSEGTYVITWTYTDASGNASSQTQTVVVNDVTAPVPNVASLPNITAECSVTITTAPTATDNCSGTITGTTSDALSYSAQGTYTITWNYNDGNGNVSTQTQTVVINDASAPVPNTATLNEVRGECSVTAVAPTATDNCAGIVTATTTDAVTYTAQGTYTITWNYNDGNGNVSSQTQTVVVDDVTAPVTATLPTVTGQCAVTVMSAPTASDNCAGIITGTTNDPLTYSAQGTYLITWSYNDGNGNISTQTQEVVVKDVTPPVIACPFDIVVNATPGTCGAVVNYNQPSATDNCGNGNLPTSIPGYTYKGTLNGHTYFVSHNQALPEDAHAAAIALGGHLATISNAAENAFVASMHPDRMWIGFTDRDAEGTYRWVTNEPITYTNWSGGEPNNCCGGPGEDWAVINWAGPTWNDWFYHQPAYYVVEFEGGNIPTTLVAGSPSGSVFPVGTTTVTYRATDVGGNTVTCSFTVTVKDVEAPVVTCPANIVVNNDAGKCGANVVMPAMNITDNCGGISITESFDNYNVGSSAGVSGLMRAWDGGDVGQITTQQAASGSKSLRISNFQDHLFLLGDQTTGKWNMNFKMYVPAGRTAYYNIQHFEAEGIQWAQQVQFSSNGTGRLNVEGMGIPFTYPQGQWFVVDQSVDLDADVTTISINGVVIRTWQFSKQANNQPGAKRLGSFDFFGATSNYANSEPNPSAISTYFIDDIKITGTAAGMPAYAPRVFNRIYPVGTTTNTINVQDNAGNTASCSYTVTVKDAEAPKAVCKNISVTLVNGKASINTGMINNGSSDNCPGPLTYSLSDTSFTCADLGDNLVTLTVTDSKGNSSTCTATVFVNGEIPTCSIASVPANNTYTGGVSTNLYLGYGPQSTTLQLSVPASGAPYTFQWSGNGTLSSNTDQSPVFAPTTAGTYTFTVFITNQYGCTTTCNITICVTDIRVGKNGAWDGKKVYVCHVPPGNAGNAHTLEISVNAVPSHIGPGGHATDRLGTCTQTPCTSTSAKAPIATDVRVSEELSVRLSPNPTSRQFILQVMSSDNKTPVVVRIMDGYGRMIETQKGSADQLYRFGSNYISGVYYIEVMQGEKKKVVQGVKAN